MKLNKDYNTQELENIFNTELKGQSYDYYSVTSKLDKIFHNVTGLETHWYFSNEGNSNNCYTMYYYYDSGKAAVFSVTVHKKKVATKRQFVYSWTEYEYGNIEVSLWSDSLQKAIDEALEMAEASKKRKNEKIEKAIEVYKLIGEVIGTDKRWEINDFIQFLDKNRYTIDTEIQMRAAN